MKPNTRQEALDIILDLFNRFDDMDHAVSASSLYWLIDEQQLPTMLRKKVLRLQEIILEETTIDQPV